MPARTSSQGLQASGLSLVAAGAITISASLLIGVMVGRWLFKMHPGVLLGVCAGGCTATPALAAVQEAARSSVPSIGYGVAYAVGNVLLAIWGTVIVALDGLNEGRRRPEVTNGNLAMDCRDAALVP